MNRQLSYGTGEHTMSDLISRQAAYETLSEYYHHRTEIQHIGLKEALDRVTDAEPERKTGKWWHCEGTLTCSECGAEIYDDIMEYLGDDVPRFCPDCGADMREES